MTHTDNNEILDEQLAILVDAKEAGRSFPQALDEAGKVGELPKDLAELRAFWGLHGQLMRSAHNISPRRELLSRVLSTLPATRNSAVTEKLPGGYNGEGAQRAPITSNVNLIMNMNWKIAVPMAVVLIAVVAVLGVGNSDSEKLAVNDPQVMMMSADPSAGTLAMKSMDVAPVSGDVDELIASLSLEADGDAGLIADMAGDIALVSSDSQQINDLNTAYDETTF